MMLYLSPLSDRLWHEYTTCLAAKKQRIPNIQPDGIWVTDDQGRFIAGCLLYPTPGEYLFAENMVVHPGATARLAQKAIEMVVEQLLMHCAHRGKFAMVLIRHRGLRNLLRRFGFQETGAIQMTRHPQVPVSVFGPKPKRFPERQQPAQVRGVPEQAVERAPSLSAKDQRRNNIKKRKASR